MEQTGAYDIPASREQVWVALNNPDILGACITGCQEVIRRDDSHFDVSVKAKIGPVRATFQAELELGDLNPPASYKINGGVKGGAAGFGKGEARVELTAMSDEATQLCYEIKANVGGKLAQVGSRLVDAAVRKMADEFFSAFKAHLEEAGSGENIKTEPHDVFSDQEISDAGSRVQPKLGAFRNKINWVIVIALLALVIFFVV